MCALSRCHMQVQIWCLGLDCCPRHASALDCPPPGGSLVDRVMGCHSGCYRAERSLSFSTIVHLPARVVDSSRIYRRVLIRERRLRA
jgi:hypothetical protein